MQNLRLTLPTSPPPPPFYHSHTPLNYPLASFGSMQKSDLLPYYLIFSILFHYFYFITSVLHLLCICSVSVNTFHLHMVTSRALVKWSKFRRIIYFTHMGMLEIRNGIGNWWDFAFPRKIVCVLQ